MQRRPRLMDLIAVEGHIPEKEAPTKYLNPMRKPRMRTAEFCGSGGSSSSSSSSS
jgi:hypothetical protein